MKKWTALITFLGLSLGLTRTTKQPYRVSMIKALIVIEKLHEAKEIIVNTGGITLKKATQSKQVLTRFGPISDDERETLCAVLRLILPKSFHEEKHHDPSSSLSTQVSIHFTKTIA